VIDAGYHAILLAIRIPPPAVTQVSVREITASTYVALLA
jgi:hypothetical protein